MGGRREVSVIFYRPVTRSDLKQERSFFRGSVSSYLQLVVAASREEGIFVVKVYYKIENSPWALTLTEPFLEGFEFSGQSAKRSSRMTPVFSYMT